MTFQNRRAVAIGLGVRLLVAWAGPFFLDDGKLLPGVSYTDIDYHVFLDAADHVRDSGSPYDRHTYRYTPFLAMLLARFPQQQAGRVIFCLADAICGWIILRLRQRQRKAGVSQESHADVTGNTYNDWADAFWWLYNPLAINICTRGSAESLLVLLPVLLTVWIVQEWKHRWWTAIAAGLCHGIAIHTKLYPIIYTLSLAIYFVPRHERTWRQSTTFLSKVTSCVRRLVLHPQVWLFLVSAAASFAGLSYIAYQQYGVKAIQESILYHFSRTDHRHNYSMHWYSIYLAQAATVSLPGLVYFVPQALLLALLSLGFADHVELALFFETFVFVALNKVITAQYFAWYLCLLPLCASRIHWSNSTLKVSLVAWLLAMLLWLFAAYRLEMVGLAYHQRVWAASVVHFAANVWLLRGLLQSIQPINGHRKQD